MSDYECFEMQIEGTISIAAVKERFRLETVTLLDGLELEEDCQGFAEIGSFLSARGDIAISGIPRPICGGGQEEDEV